MAAKKAKTPVKFTDVEVSHLRDLLCNSAITYPRSILKRRLEFLNATDRKKVRAVLKYIEELEDQIDMLVVEQIDDVISEEAERREDPWR